MSILDHRTFLAQDFALINPMQLASEQRRDLDALILLPAGMERHSRMMPLLVTLKCLSEARRLTLLERSDRWAKDYDMPFFSALLVSDADPVAIGAHLKRNMIVRREKVVDVWLRFHDPRVFRHIRWILSARQMASFLGPILSWTWREPLSGDWHVHVRPEHHRTGPVHLTSDQWSALDFLEDVNCCLRDIAEDTGSAPDDDAVRELFLGLGEARAAGLTDVADVRFYATQRLRLGSGYTEREDVRECLRRMRADRMSYVAATMASRAPAAAEE